MAKRLPAERVPPTDEWGIYDPAKAGMQALFARLGRPVLRGSSKKIRQERRRSYRPERERSSDGVGLAIKEAMDRAGAMDRAALEARNAELEAKIAEAGAPVAVEAVIPPSPARAVRVALKATRPAKTVAAMLEDAAPPPVAPDATVAGKRKTARRAKLDVEVVATEPASAPAPPQAMAAAPVADHEPGPRARVRKAAKSRAKAEPAATMQAAPVPQVPVAPVAPVPPAPSPRRPRGPVPLAAWAHAVTDAPKPEPKRGDKRGFWKGIFRIPADVALVEYAHGCRIHRLLIETSDELPMLDLI